MLKPHNPYRGEYHVQIGDTLCTIRFDWDAIAKAFALYGDMAISDLFNGFKPDELAGLLAIVVEKNHPELTAEKIKEISPPYIPCVKALDKAMAYAYFGIESPDDAQKKSLIARMVQRIKEILLRNRLDYAG